MSNYTIKRTIMGQLPCGSDLYEELTTIVQKENIRLGRIHGIGATKHAVVAYYDQKTKNYKPLEFEGGMEILNLYGNVSLRDGKPFVHLHVLLGDPEGKVYGGHVLPGTTLYAFEMFIDEFDGEALVREYEGETGLHLWKSGYLK